MLEPVLVLTLLLLSIDLNDTSGIPTRQVLHILMSSLKRGKNVYGYVVSGYPRHLRDVAVYSEKVRLSPNRRICNSC